MSLRASTVARLRALFRGSHQDRELDEELRFHLAHEIDMRVGRGETPQAARHAALAAFGSVEACKDDVRDARGIRPLTDLAGDARYAVRSLSRSPGFTLAVVLVLGLATGAAATMFSVASAVFFSDLPYPDAGRLVRIYQANSPLNHFSLSMVDAQGLLEHSRSFSALGFVQRSEAALSGAGAPQRVTIVRATADFFAALDVAAGEGRLLGVADQVPGADPVVVASHALALQVAGSAAAAVGRTLTLDGIGHTIVGVLPAGVDDLAGLDAAAWPALTMTTPTRRGPFWLRGIARLRPGVALEAAERDLAAVSERLFPLWASSFQDREARLVPIPLRDTIVGDAAGPVRLFAVAVGLVLLIAVANVATLMLVRASARRPELAVRATLGATRMRLARLLATENLLLGLAAGGLACAVALAGGRAVQAMAPDLPRAAAITVDLRTLAFIVVTTLATALVLTLSLLTVALPGRSPASLRTDARRIGTSRRAQTLRGFFVAAEFALALPLLLGAGLLLDSVVRLQRVDPGFDPAGLASVNLSLPAARYESDEDVLRFWRQVLDRTGGLPGVTAVGLTASLPPDNGGDVNNFDLRDRPVPVGTAQPVAPWTAVGGDYFATMGIPLLDGRLFSELDTADAPPVLLVSRSWANRYYPRERAVGRQLVSGGCTRCPPSTIVGVVGDVKYLGLREEGEGVYVPTAQAGWRTMNLMVRSAGPIEPTLRVVRDAVAALDPELPTAGTAMTDRLDASLADPRRWTAVLGSFAAVALALAALGTFGLVSYVVRQRRREIGIRIALGANPRSVTGLVMRQGMQHAGIGVAVGVVLAGLEGRALQPLLFEVKAFEPAPLAGVAAVLLGSAALACWLPGRRAGRVHPSEILSAE